MPFFGATLVDYLWGGFSVGDPTLTRFSSLHYFLPYLITGAAVLHLL
jgi:quinol-cytochrome oxidoreductase complex cytochrome b subunit